VKETCLDCDNSDLLYLDCVPPTLLREDPLAPLDDPLSSLTRVDIFHPCDSVPSPIKSFREKITDFFSYSEDQDSDRARSASPVMTVLVPQVSLTMDDYCVLCQDAHKMISSCFKDVQCKNCLKKGHLRIDCPKDSSTNVDAEIKLTRFEQDCETASKDHSEVSPKPTKVEKLKIKEESFDDNNNASIDDLIKVEQKMLHSTEQESMEAVVSTLKQETEVEDIVKGEYFEETSDSVKYEVKSDFDNSIVSDTKKAESVQKKSERRRRKKPKKRKLPGEPMKPMSAFFIWLNEEGREQMAQENPGGSVTERARSAGARWKVLDEITKKKYEGLHEESRVKYKEEYKDWLEDGGEELIKQVKEKKREAQILGRKSLQPCDLTRRSSTEFQSKEFIEDSDSGSD